MASYEHVFRPLRIGRVTSRNRIETAPGIPFLATPDYFVTRELIEWHRAFAKSGAGIVTVGDSQVDLEDAKRHGRAHTICLGDDRVVAGLSALAEAIQLHGALASIELNFGGIASPTEMSQDDIRTTIESFVRAADRCMHAGMDMIMVHGGHGHLVGQFFSPLTNQRSDQYGGSISNRARFANELLESIRAKVGQRMAIEYRLSGDELVPGAPSVEEPIEFVKSIEDKIDLIHVSAGNFYTPETAQRMIQPLYIPRGVNVYLAERFKRELQIPITTVGSINMDMAEEILAANKADVVAMIRTVIADPECVEKARHGKGEEIRPCLRCDTCLTRSRSYLLPTRCAVNPVAGREAEFMSWPAPARKKKVVVVGGGPGGMEAARTAAARGHEVVLFEKAPELGGALEMAAAPPFKEDIKKYLHWARSMTMNMPRLEVRLSTPADADTVLAEKADAMVIAVGAEPVIPTIPGIERKTVIWAGDVDAGKATLGDTVLVVGAGMTGCETALHLAQEGKKVTVIDMLPLDETAQDSSIYNLMVLRNLLERLNVALKGEMRLTEVTETGAKVKDKDGRELIIACDTVVLSVGVRPRYDVVNELQGAAPDVYVIGDCRRERSNIFHAVTDGFNAATNI
jgi:2,4-dienoyl-CoA reductase-like NADH-dependent reductase (Old Yellow Enzyme family)/thioredoxin reductase